MRYARILFCFIFATWYFYRQSDFCLRSNEVSIKNADKTDQFHAPTNTTNPEKYVINARTPSLEMMYENKYCKNYLNPS